MLDYKHYLSENYTDISEIFELITKSHIFVIGLQQYLDLKF